MDEDAFIQWLKKQNADLAANLAIKTQQLNTREKCFAQMKKDVERLDFVQNCLPSISRGKNSWVFEGQEFKDVREAIDMAMSSNKQRRFILLKTIADAQAELDRLGEE